MVDEVTLADSMKAVQLFVQNGDVSANFTLYQHLQKSLGGEGQWTPASVLDTLAPSLLQRLLEIYQKGHLVDSGTLFFVSILNQVMCLKFLPESLMRPLDRRPTGLQELACFYQNTLSSCGVNSSFHLPPLLRRQLITCLGCVLVLLDDDIADTLRHRFDRATRSSSSSSLSSTGLSVPDTVEEAFELYNAVIDILSDHRVAIGSIRRSNQRKCLQAQLDMLLVVPAHGDHLMRLQAEAIVKGIEFLMLGTISEPREVARAFWQQLPKSALWWWALCHLTASDEISRTTSQELVSVVLRSLGTVDAPAEELLFSSLTSLMNASVSDVVISCKIITASMGSTMESVILHHGRDSSIFALISSAAEYLLMVLRAPDAPEEAVRAVCEGISVLAQSLTLVHVPAMDPTDDPEDHMEFVESIKRKNSEKSQCGRHSMNTSPTASAS